MATYLRDDGPIADRLFLVLHRDRDGVPLAAPRVCGLALAGALLAELVSLGWIDVRDGSVLVHHSLYSPMGSPPTGEPMLDSLLDLMRKEPVLTLAQWLPFLATDAVGEVGRRLHRAQRVKRHAFGRRMRWVPTDINDAGWQSVRLRLALERRATLTTHDAVLAGLVAVAGLLGQVCYENPAVAREHLTATVATLPAALSAIVTAVDATIAESVHAGRA